MVSAGPRSRPLVLVATPSHNLEGGAERIIQALAAGLPNLGIDVVLGLARGSVYNVPERFAALCPGTRWVPLEGRTGTAEGRRRGIRRAIGAVKPDLVLNVRLFDVFSVMAELKSNGSAIRFATTVLAYEPEYILDLALFSGFVDLCATNGVRTAEAVVRLSGLPAETVVNIPGGVRRASRGVVRSSPPAPLRIGYVGRISQLQKRILDLPETLRALRDANVPFHCRIVGAGPEEDALRRAVAALGLGDAVAFEGWLSTEMLYEHVYPELDVLLSFADFEGVPISPREAMAHGCAVVMASYRGCAAERFFRHDENCLLFPPGDAASAADLVRALALDPPLRERLGASAAASVRGAYEADGALQLWAGRLMRAMSEPARRASDPPALASSPAGRLDRILGGRRGEAARRALRRHPALPEAGAEWPHWSGRHASSALSWVLSFADETGAGTPPRVGLAPAP